MNSIIDLKKTGLSAEPVSLSTAKGWLYITYDDDDTMLAQLIKDCRKALEAYTNMSLGTKTITLTVDLCEEMELPHGPVIAVTSVKVRTGSDAAGVATYDTLTAADYTIDGDQFKRFKSSRMGRHVIVYTVGLTTGEEYDDLFLAIKNEIGYRYEHRGDENQTLAAEKVGCVSQQES
jgi:uncharacterized phiE125 gp8 family phage protein